jgi:hypothetical protein
MKKSLTFIVICCFFGCSIFEAKLVRKKIEENNITVKWYYYSYITSGSPDIVEVESSGNTKEIFKATEAILNVQLANDTIFIKVINDSTSFIYMKNIDTNVFGYTIVIDSTGSYDELRFRPDAVKEWF